MKLHNNKASMLISSAGPPAARPHSHDVTLPEVAQQWQVSHENKMRHQEDRKKKEGKNKSHHKNSTSNHVRKYSHLCLTKKICHFPTQLISPARQDKWHWEVTRSQRWQQSGSKLGVTNLGEFMPPRFSLSHARGPTDSENEEFSGR